MADVLLRLGEYTGEPRHRDRALEILVAWAPHYGQYGVAAAPYGAALLRYLDHPAHIVVVGDPGDAATQRLHTAALNASVPLRTVQLLDPCDAGDAARMAATGFERAATPAAYVCRGLTCLAPAADPTSLMERLASG